MVEGGPILAKLRAAAGDIRAAQTRKEKVLSERSLYFEGKDRTFIHVDYDADQGGVTLVFVGTEDWDTVTKDRHSARVTPPWAPHSDIKVHKLLNSQLMSFVRPHKSGQLGLIEAMVYLSGGYIPRRVTCLGHALGGGLATLAAAWAALTVPTADVRCITFGAPRVGNTDFAHAYVNLVGITYRVVFGADPTPHHPRPLFYSHVAQPIWFDGNELKYEEAPPTVKRVPDRRLQNYLDAVAGVAGEPVRRTFFEEAAVQAGNAVEDMKSMAEAALPKQGSISTSGLAARGVDDFELPPALTRRRGAASGGVASGDRVSLAGTILGGKIAQATLLAWHAYDDEATFREKTGLANAVLITYERLDTQVYVAWLEGGTAVFAFRGTESARDAQADLDARREPIDFMAADFPGVLGHMGFMGQFRSITDPSAAGRHIGLTLDRLSAGALPTRVLCCGHSLGGALATLAAAWAAYEYPAADIRCVTLGSPRVGNRVFVRAAKYLVGSMHRLVHSWDPVPTVPPPGPFKHVKGRMFLHKGHCTLARRPWYMSWGLLLGRAADHFVDPYAAIIAAESGREISAATLGLLSTTAEGGLEETAAKPEAPASGGPVGTGGQHAPGLVITGGEGEEAQMHVAQEAHADADGDGDGDRDGGPEGIGAPPDPDGAGGLRAPGPPPGSCAVPGPPGRPVMVEASTDPVWDGFGKFLGRSEAA